MDRKQLQIVAMKEEMERMRMQQEANSQAQFLERVMLASLSGAAANFKEPKQAAKFAFELGNEFLVMLTQSEEQKAEDKTNE